MSLLQAVRSAEQVVNNTIKDALIPVGILRGEDGGVTINPVTLEVESVGGAECIYAQGVSALYSSLELASPLAGMIDIGTGSKKFLVKGLSIIPVVGDSLIVWGNSDVTYQKFSVRGLDASTNPALPQTEAKIAWIITRDGTVGGLSVVAGDLLHSPTGSVGGLWNDVQTDWVKETFSQKADVVLVNHQTNLGVNFKMLHVKF